MTGSEWRGLATGGVIVLAGLTYRGVYKGRFRHLRNPTPDYRPTLAGRVVLVTAGLLCMWLALTGRVQF